MMPARYAACSLVNTFILDSRQRQGDPFFAHCMHRKRDGLERGMQHPPFFVSGLIVASAPPRVRERRCNVTRARRLHGASPACPPSAASVAASATAAEAIA